MAYAFVRHEFQILPAKGFCDAWIGNLYDHTGIDNRHLKVSANAPAFVADPTRQPVPMRDSTLTETTEIVVMDRGFILPQEVRWTIGMDMSLPHNLLLTFEGVYSRTLSGIVFKNINLKPSGTLGSTLGGDERTVYGVSLPAGQWVCSRNSVTLHSRPLVIMSLPSAR